MLRGHVGHVEVGNIEVVRLVDLDGGLTDDGR